MVLSDGLSNGSRSDGAEKTPASDIDTAQPKLTASLLESQDIDQSTVFPNSPDAAIGVTRLHRAHLIKYSLQIVEDVGNGAPIATQILNLYFCVFHFSPRSGRIAAR
jgi:hypothetical protein